MSTRSISVFALTALFFVLGSVNSSANHNPKIVESKQAVDFCCLAGLSCCIFPPRDGGSSNKNQLTPRASESTSANDMSRQERMAPTERD